MNVRWPTVLTPAYVVLPKKPHSGQNLFVRKPPAICDPHFTDPLDRHRRLAALVAALVDALLGGFDAACCPLAATQAGSVMFVRTFH